MRVKALATVVLLITYGSLYPFDFRAADDPLAAIAALLADRQWWTSRGDVLGNVGLFVPLGLVGVLWTSGPAARRRAVLVTVLGGFTLAFALQVVQIWIASRSAVFADVIWNALGIVIGIIAGLVAASPAVLRRVSLGAGTSSAVCLLAIWAVAELAPLVPAIDFGGIKASLRPLVRAPVIDGPQLAYTAAQVLLVSRLVSAITSAGRANAILAAILAAVLAGKVVIVDLVLDWTTVAGFTLGLLGSVLLRRGPGRPVPSEAVLLLLLSTYTLGAMAPFSFGPSRTFFWIPFAAALDGSMLSNLRAISTAAFALGGCAWLMRDLGWSAVPAVGGLAAWALMLEVTQMWVAGRTASTNEPVLALLAGWLLWHVESGRDGSGRD